jgi:predicted GH43/DUF377 family glycosyl hydrolase
MNRRLVAAAVLAGALTLPSTAAACSRDDKAYFDGFPDASCLLTLDSTEIDTFGGLRLVTDGAVTGSVWDTAADFTNGISYSGKTFPPVGTPTLAIGGAGTLTLPATEIPLTPAAGPAILPTASAWRDSDGVVDPAVVRQGSTYAMFYAGTAEDGSGPAIFRLTSSDGETWTRPADPAQHLPVLEGTPGTFDENGVFGPDVVFDPADTVAPLKMWYSGRGDVFDQIGYATSTDGVAWTKHAGPVLTAGLPGSQDSFAAAHPTVLFDNGLWKMWYEGDDSNKKSIHYATSTDGIIWSKAGAVIESGSGNVEFGVFAPTVYKDQSTLRMLVGGRKEVSGGVLQTKLIAASSQNGLDWTLGNIALNTGSFASSNLSSPEVVLDPGATDAFKLYYSGNSANGGDPRDRIGYADSTGGTAQQMVLDIAPRGTAFDSREVSGVAAADPDGSPDEMAGVYTGFKEDGQPRLGAARSATGTSWIKVAGPEEFGSLLKLGTNNQFDDDGQRDPSLLYEKNGAAGKDYFLYFTGLDNGVPTIGMSTADEAATTLQPDHATWSDPTGTLLGLGAGGTFDDAGVAHPSVVKRASDYALYYTATGPGGTSIGRALSSTNSPSAAFASRAQVTFTGAATCDPSGRRDPVAFVPVAGGDVHLLYTGLESVDLDGDGTSETIERTCHARSADGLSFTRTGVALNPSQIPFAFDEAAVAPASVAKDGTTALRVFTTGRDRSGRTRGGFASTPLPLPAAGVPAGGIPSGWATYQLGDETTPARDFRSIAGSSTGSAVELWMSVLQPYSTGSNQYWSRFFEVDAATASLPLNFLLTIRGVRWQVRLRGAAGAPALNSLTIGTAPVHFAPAGTATTTDIVPPDDFTLQSWTNLTVSTELFRPLGTGAGGVSVTVLDDAGATLVGPTAITVPGEQVVSLAGIDAATKKKLRLKFDLTSAGGDATPLVGSAKVEYAAAQPNATPTPTPTPSPAPAPAPTPVPPPPAVLTLAAAPKVVYGKSTSLSGRLTVGGAGVAGRVLAVLQQPVGTTAPVALTTVTTDATGTFALVVRPKKKTVYSLALAGVTAPAPVTVSVAHALTLRVALRGRRATFTGKLGPKHVRRTVTLQRKSGTRWVRYARLKTGSRSTFKLVKRLAKGRHQFRAITAADRDHLAGRSVVRKVRVR